MCGTHTIRYVTDGETYADYFPDGDCCDEFIDLFGDSFIVNGEENRVCGYFETFGFSGDGWNEPRIEEVDERVATVRFCPFCGARIIVKN